MRNNYVMILTALFLDYEQKSAGHPRCFLVDYAPGLGNPIGITEKEMNIGKKHFCENLDSKLLELDEIYREIPDDYTQEDQTWSTRIRYAFVIKPKNYAKYGKNAPRDGYIHSWEESYDSSQYTDKEISELEEMELFRSQEFATHYMGPENDFDKMMIEKVLSDDRLVPQYTDKEISELEAMELFRSQEFATQK